MGFACEDDLYGHVGAVDDIQQAVNIGEDEVGAFVCGETARKANGQCIGVDEHARRNDLHGMVAALSPTVTHALTHVEGEWRN